MKTQFTVDKEFIKEAYNSACPDWKDKLKNKFPEAFESELEVGKWYKHLTADDFIIFNIDNYRGYGVNSFGKWEIGRGWTFTTMPNYWTLATDKEVETALIAEAKRRGFNKTTMITQTFDENQKMCIGFWDESSVKFERNKLFAKGVRIFDNGKWAEIISEPIEITLEQIAEKFNVNVEQLKIKK